MPMLVKRIVPALLVLGSLLRIAAAAEPAKPAQEPKPQLMVTYYYLPACAICAKTKPDVTALEQEFQGRVKTENLDATTDASKKAVKDLGFQSHGLVIRSADGKVLHKEADHGVDLAEVRKVVRDLLKQTG